MPSRQSLFEAISRMGPTTPSKTCKANRPRWRGTTVWAVLLTVIPVSAGEKDQPLTAILADGREVAGTIILSKDAGFLFPFERQSIPLANVQSVRFPRDPHAFPVVTPVPLKIQCDSGDEWIANIRAITDTEIRLDTAWKKNFTIPKGIISSISLASDFVPVQLETFEQPSSSWTFEREGSFGTGPSLSEKKSLTLFPGRSAEWTFAEPRREGRLWVGYHDEQDKPASPLLELELQFAKEKIAVEVPRVERVGFPYASGWHAVEVDFGPDALIVARDGLILRNQREELPDSPLESIRLIGKPNIKYITIDDVALLTRREPTESSHFWPVREQDEVHTQAGDVLFGEITALEREKVKFTTRLGDTTFAWEKIDQLSFKQERVPFTPTEGLHVRIGLHDNNGQRDTLTGVLKALHQGELKLAHPLLGELSIPTMRVDRIEPLFQGTRLLLNPHLHQKSPVLGRLATMREWSATFELSSKFESVDLSVWGTPQPNTSRIEVWLNGMRVDEVQWDELSAETRLTLPRDRLRQGPNLLELKQRRGNSAIHRLGVELQTKKE